MVKDFAGLENRDASVSRFDTIIGQLLIALLIFMPFAYGARNAWSEEVVVILSGVIFICFLLKLVFHRNQGIAWSWAYIPIGIFLLIAILQLIPLPGYLINLVSHNTAILKTELLGDLPDADTQLKTMRISFYPNATRHDLRLVLSAAAVFIAVFNVFRRPGEIKRLLLAVAAIGGIVALITLAQKLFGNNKIISWFVANPSSESSSGPFLNHNHYGQFINLSIGAALGWVCVKLHEDFASKKINPVTVLDYLSCSSAKLLWLLIVIMSLCAATVFLSLTRGGMISMLAAASFTTLLLCSRRSLRGRGWVMVVMALAAFTCILTVGFDAVYDRFATLSVLEQYHGRSQIIKDVIVAFRRFFLFGTGLGTHAVVYPMFQNINVPLLFTHAENEYAQAAEETGIVGLVMLIIFGIIVWASYARNIRRTNVPICSAAYGLGFGLLAILVNSLSDFGQHVPANAFLSVIFCALVLSLTQQKENEDKSAQTVKQFRNSKVLSILVLLGVCGIWTWVILGANNARIAEARWKEVLHIEKGLVDKAWRGSKTEYADIISQATAASDYQPENILYRYCLNVYRWYSISKTEGSDIQDIIIPEEKMPLVHEIVDELNKARTFCPTYGPTYSMAGQIEKFIFNDDIGAEKIRKGFRLAPCDPIACFVAGRLDVLEGNIDASIGKFEKAIELDKRLFKDVVNMYINKISRPHLAISAAGDNIDRLRYVATVLEDMQYYDLAKETREKLKARLEAKCSQPDATATDFISLASIYRQQRNNDEAIEYYRRALKLNYGEVYWRFDLAQILAEEGKIGEAIHEARICLRLRPQFTTAEQLIGKLCVMPVAISEKESDTP